MSLLEIVIAPITNLNPQDEKVEKLMVGIRNNLLSAFSRIVRFKVYSENFDPTLIEEDYNGYTVRCSMGKTADKIYFSAAIIHSVHTEEIFQWSEVASQLAELELQVHKRLIVHLLGTQKVVIDANKEVRLSQRTYEDYLLARYYAKRYNPVDTEKAIECYKKVLDEYPDHSPALSGIATAYFQQFRYGVLKKDYIQNLNSWICQAIESDTENVEAYTTLALLQMYLNKDFYAAGVSFQNALALERDYPEVLKEYCWFLLAIRQDKKSIEAVDKALEYDPLSLDLLCTKADLYRYMEQYEKSLKVYKKAFELEKFYVRSIEGITACYTYLDNRELAEQYLNIYEKQDANQFWRNRLSGELGVHFNDHSMVKHSLRLLNEYRQAHPEADLSSDFMSIYAGWDIDKAIEYLQQAFDSGVGLVSIIRYPVLKPLHPHKVYRKLLANLQLNIEVDDLSRDGSRLVRIKSDLHESFTVQRAFFLYAEADGNYSNIYFLKDGKLKTRLLRVPLGRTLKQIGDGFFRIHNSYLVNLMFSGIRLTGNAHSAKLLIERYEVKLPVSRAAYKSLKETLSH